jgi:AcrR family transcriptional regulator
MPEINKPRPSRKGQRRRQDILDTARTILVDEGWEAFSMREVATRLGIRHGHLQYYFPTKQDLLVALYDAEVSAYTSGMSDAVERARTRESAVEGILDSGIATAQRPETQLWRIAAALARRDNEMNAILARDNQLYREGLMAAFSEIAPELTRQRRAVLARFVQVLVDGLSLQMLTDDPSSVEMRSLARLLKAVTLSVFDDQAAASSSSGKGGPYRERGGQARVT